MGKIKENKIVKVKLLYPEDDAYVELWKVVDPKKNEPRYYGRYTYQDYGTWCYVCDPLGYRELDHRVPDDVTFIICDSNGNECCRYSNAEENPLPKLETVVHRQWRSCKDKIPSTETESCFKKWLLSFKDPEKYQKEIENMHGYEENWIYPTREELSCEPIPGTEFAYLGKPYVFSAIQIRHTICGVTWTEYHCTDSPVVRNETHNSTYSLGIFGYQFNEDTYGPMYDAASARDVVRNAILQAFPEQTEDFFVVTREETQPRITTYQLPVLIKHLLGWERYRNKVDSLADSIRNGVADGCLKYGAECIYPDTNENREVVRQDLIM